MRPRARAAPSSSSRDAASAGRARASSASRVAVRALGPGARSAPVSLVQRAVRGHCAHDAQISGRSTPGREVGRDYDRRRAVDDLVRRPLAGAHGAVHVALPERRRLAAGPVHAAGGAAERGAVAAQDAGRRVGGRQPFVQRSSVQSFST